MNFIDPTGFAKKNIVFVGNSWTFSENGDSENDREFYPNTPALVVKKIGSKYATPSVVYKNGKHSESLQKTTQGGMGTKYWSQKNRMEDIVKAVNNSKAKAVSMMFGSADFR